MGLKDVIALVSLLSIGGIIGAAGQYASNLDGKNQANLRRHPPHLRA